VIDLDHPHFSADKARALLRRLRDLNLSTGPITVRGDRAVCLAGCSSLDAPAESGVRYRLRMNDEREASMELAWSAAGLELVLSGVASNAPDAKTGASTNGASTRRPLNGTGNGTSAARPKAASNLDHAPRANGASFTLARLCLAVTCDRQGRACVREIGARVSPDSTDERELEHFLRRAVRSLLS